MPSPMREERTCAEPEVYNEKGETHIVLMHYGCKRNIVRCLSSAAAR